MDKWRENRLKVMQGAQEKEAEKMREKERER